MSMVLYRQRQLARKPRFLAGVAGTAGALYKTGQLVKNAYNGANQVKRALSSPPSQQTVTDHHDVSVMYKSRRPNRRKMRRKVNFSRRVHRAIEDRTSSNHQVILATTTLITASNKQQGTAISSLGTINGNNTLANSSNHIQRLFVLHPGIDKMHLTGAMAETVVTNVSPSTVILDLYYWVARKSMPTNESPFVYPDYGDLTPNIPTGGSSLDIQDYGVTPFQSPDFTRNNKIVKKVKVKLGAGETTQFKQSVKLNKYLRYTSLERFTTLKGLSRGVFIIAYGIPSATNNIADPVTLRFVHNVNYTYKLLDTTPQTGGTTTA